MSKHEVAQDLGAAAVAAVQAASAAASSAVDSSTVGSAVQAIESLPVYQSLTAVLPAPDLFFGAFMLILIMLVHTAGMRFITNRLEFRLKPLRAKPSTWRPDVVMSGSVFFLVAVHLLEIYIWSAALMWMELVKDWSVAGFFAANTYTTVGYGSMVLSKEWRMLAPIIAMSGLFTFGWTGSVLVEIVRRCQEVKNAAWKIREEATHARKHSPGKPPG